MLNAGGPQAGQHGDGRAVETESRVDSVLRADPRANPDRHLYCPADRVSVQDCFFGARTGSIRGLMAKSQSELTRLLKSPDLPSIVPHLEPELLHRVIQTNGLEDCGEIVALATPVQLARVLDIDLWRVPAPGADEQFDPDRFGLWLEVLLDAGADVAADKLAGLDLDLVAARFAPHLAVFDVVAATPYTMLHGEEMQAPMSGRARAAEIGGYVLETRRTSAWDAILELLAFLASERPGYFHRLMRACVGLSNGAREEDASYSVLEDAEQHL